MATVANMIRPKFYLARRDTRWDVYPQKEPLQIVAHDWNGFWGRVEDVAGATGHGWFKHPASFVLCREITQEEAERAAPFASEIV